MRLVLSIIAAATVALAVVAGATAHHRCTPVSGDFTSVLVTGPECASPIGMCTHGILTGDLRGTYDFVFTSLMPAGDPSDPLKMVYTGTSKIVTQGGTMIGQDTGWLRINPTGPSAFETTVNIVGGTGKYKKATGFIVATGELNLVTGEAVGTYTGEICRYDEGRGSA